MSALRIDVVSPPYHGHLHPNLGLARLLRNFADVRVITTEDAVEAVALAGLQHLTVMKGRTEDVWQITNTALPVKGHPLRLLKQLRQNLALLPVLDAELDSVWQLNKPDLALVDFTLPGAGLRARKNGIRWWTTHASPLAIETGDGPPSYLGGWSPRSDLLGRIRDVLGRVCVRQSKKGAYRLYASSLREIGLTSVYRKDGSENAYSDELILALGSESLEFSRAWPKSVKFTGPIIYTPPLRAGGSLKLAQNRRNVLVTFGTHLLHRRERIQRWVARWAEALPSVCFHYTAGGSDCSANESRPNWHAFRYLDYASVIRGVDAVIHHGGAGIVYHCLCAGKPALVFPQDYDQFDFAARIQWRKLGLRVRREDEVPALLDRLLADPEIHREVTAMASALKQENPMMVIHSCLQSAGLLTPHVCN